MNAPSLLALAVPMFAVPACGPERQQEPPSGHGSRSPSPAAAPRLVVLCCVDQLASWVFEEGEPHFLSDDGFRRLRRQGATFTDCAYEHACTETGPGHATIGTGAPASAHGIVRNAWWSPPDGHVVYCVGEVAAPLPGMAIGRNRGPGRLLAPTLSQVMRRELAGCRTASVSWKDRSAILMVGEHADVAAWIEARDGDLVTNTEWCDEVPQWIRDFNTERAIDGFHGTEWRRVGPDSAYEGLVDDRPYEVAHPNGTNERTLPQLLTGGKDEPDLAYYNQLYQSPQGNTVVRLAAQAAVEGMQLGADDVPDLLAVSFSSTDVVGHYFGPDSVEARDALLRLDAEIAAFLGFLDERVGEGRYTLFLTADHGVGPTPQWARARGLDAGRGLLQTRARAAAERDITRRFGKPAGGGRYCVHVGEWALVLDRAAFAGDDAAARFAEACDIAAAAAVSVRGIAHAYTTRDILENDPGDDEFRRALRKALHPERAGDVQLVVEPYWLDGVIPASHGTPHAYDREVVAFAIGAGVPRGVEVSDRVTPGFGVVLFSHLLGIPAPAMAVDELPEVLRASK